MPAPIGRHIALVALVGACSSADDERSGWLRHTLVLDNQDLFERDAELTQGKFAKMSESPYAYLRGSVAQMDRDLLEPGGAGLRPWRFTSADVDDVALVGDPHPENIGCYRTGDGTITLDFNDFDAATYGPFELDVRRLALGFWVACAQVRDELGEALVTDGDCAAITAGSAQGYADEIAALAADPADATVVDEDGDWGPIVAALLEDSREDGDDGKPLLDYTIVEGDRRAMIEGDLEPARVVDLGEYRQPVLEDTVRPVPASVRNRAQGWIEQWRSTLWDPSIASDLSTEILGITRRYGAGVSSYPLLRYYVLLAGPTAAPDDDLLLEVKEVRDPPPLPGLRRPIDAPYPGNGARVVAFARELQAFVDDDPWLGWADEGARAYRIRERSGYQNGFEVADLSAQLGAGEWNVDDAREFAAIAGRVLARSHARARRARGTPAGDAIAAAIDDAAAFVDDVTGFATDYGEVVLADHLRLRDLLATHGPDLGYGTW